MGYPRGPFVVPLATLEEGANRILLRGGGEDAGISCEDTELVGDIVLSGCFVRTEAQVEIQARLEATVRQVCDRCVAPMETRIDSPVRVICEKRGKRSLGRAAGGRAEETGLMYHDGRVLDLRDEIREVILLEVPWHPLCAPECKGLCPRCGKDRNLGDCGCPSGRMTGPWQALRELIEAEGHPSDRSREKE